MKLRALLASTLVAALALASTAHGRLATRQRQHHGRHHATSSSPRPDQVLEWNEEMLRLLQTPGAQPATVHPTRTMAITQLSVLDAVDAIIGGFEPYGFRLPAPHDASPEAAAAAAARTALLALLPSQRQAIEAKFQESLKQIGSGPRVSRGIRVGEQAAHEILGA